MVRKRQNVFNKFETVLFCLFYKPKWEFCRLFLEFGMSSSRGIMLACDESVAAVVDYWFVLVVVHGVSTTQETVSNDDKD